MSRTNPFILSFIIWTGLTLFVTSCAFLPQTKGLYESDEFVLEQQDKGDNKVHLKISSKKGVFPSPLEVDINKEILMNCYQIEGGAYSYSVVEYQLTCLTVNSQYLKERMDSTTHATIDTHYKERKELDNLKALYGKRVKIYRKISLIIHPNSPASYPFTLYLIPDKDELMGYWFYVDFHHQMGKDPFERVLENGIK